MKNPYAEIFYEAVARAKYWQGQGVPAQAEWFRRMALIHKGAAADWAKRQRL